MNLEEEDDIDTCAQCKKRQNAVSNLTEQIFLINTDSKCGHKFCSSCVEREFHRKRQFACPKCSTLVARDKVQEELNNILREILCLIHLFICFSYLKKAWTKQKLNVTLVFAGK